MSLDGISGTSDLQAATLDTPQTPTADQVREQEIRTTLTNNPPALEALDGLVGDDNYAQLDEAQKLQALEAFAATPNAATAAHQRGQAAVALNPGTDSSLLAPDAGALTIGGQTYTIEHGQLLDAQGQPAGTIGNDGSFQLTGQEAQSVYDDINARVQLREQVGNETIDLLSLHPADPNGRLDNANLNPQIVERAEAVLEQARREGLDMRVVSDFRSVEQQDRLYAQGRTTPGEIVTNARGGSSWHNYGLAVDIAFNDVRGQPAWPEDGNWTRYGEIAVDQGLEWGGNWQRFPDRPHIEFHPGFGAGEARNLLNTYREGGLDAVWQRMGIGQ